MGNRSTGDGVGDGLIGNYELTEDSSTEVSEYHAGWGGGSGEYCGYGPYSGGGRSGATEVLIGCGEWI